MARYKAFIKELLSLPEEIRLSDLIWLMQAYNFNYREVTKQLKEMEISEGEIYYFLHNVYPGWQVSARTGRCLYGRHTNKEWEAKKLQYDYRCFYCGKKVKQLTKDHVVPVVDAGSNTIDNIVPACKSCNSKKNKRAISKFKQGAMLKML